MGDQKTLCAMEIIPYNLLFCPDLNNASLTQSRKYFQPRAEERDVPLG